MVLFSQQAQGRKVLVLVVFLYKKQENAPSLPNSFIRKGEKKMEVAIVEHDSDGVVWFTIHRPEKRNAIDFEVMDKLEETIAMAEKNDNVKMLVITGTGDEAFCSGGDLSNFQHLQAEAAKQMLEKMGKILYSLLTLPKPTVALINGTAIGGGCELATACDFRYAKGGSKIGFVQGKLGITTGWGGATMLLEKLPYTQALDILLRAERISAEKCVSMDGFTPCCQAIICVKNAATCSPLTYRNLFLYCGLIKLQPQKNGRTASFRRGFLLKSRVVQSYGGRKNIRELSSLFQEIIIFPLLSSLLAAYI